MKLQKGQIIALSRKHALGDAPWFIVDSVHHDHLMLQPLSNSPSEEWYYPDGDSIRLVSEKDLSNRSWHLNKERRWWKDRVDEFDYHIRAHDYALYLYRTLDKSTLDAPHTP